MRGILLDPRTGRPEEFSPEEARHIVRSRAPDHVLKSLDKAEYQKWAGPKADRTLFRTRKSPDFMANPAAVAPTSATETALFAASTYTPIPALSPYSGQNYKITATGTVSSPATAGTLVVTPRYATAAGGGVALGASVASATGAINITAAPWTLQFWFDFRIVNNTAASSSTGVGHGFMTFGNNLFTTPVPLTFGGTLATTLDTTTAQGLFIGITMSVGSYSWQVQNVVMETFD